MIKIILQMACSLLLITIGFALCVGQFYYKGIKDSGYEEGYSKGFDTGTEYVIDLIKDKEKGDE